MSHRRIASWADVLRRGTRRQWRPACLPPRRLGNPGCHVHTRGRSAGGLGSPSPPPPPLFHLSGGGEGGGVKRGGPGRWDPHLNLPPRVVEASVVPFQRRTNQRGVAPGGEERVDGRVRKRAGLQARGRAATGAGHHCRPRLCWGHQRRCRLTGGWMAAPQLRKQWWEQEEWVLYLRTVQYSHTVGTAAFLLRGGRLVQYSTNRLVWGGVSGATWLQVSFRGSAAKRRRRGHLAQ